MKIVGLILVCVLALGGAHGQGIERMRERLARPDGLGGARCEVVERPDAASAVESAERGTRRTRIAVYRVNIFNDNSQTAGANAAAVTAQWRELYPAVSVHLSYDTPYFRVVAGCFFDRVDAIALCGKVTSHFPKAFVKREEISVAQLLSNKEWLQNRDSLPTNDENVEAGDTN